MVSVWLGTEAASYTINRWHRLKIISRPYLLQQNEYGCWTIGLLLAKSWTVFVIFMFFFYYTEYLSVKLCLRDHSLVIFWKLNTIDSKTNYIQNETLCRFHSCSWLCRTIIKRLHWTVKILSRVFANNIALKYINI